MLGMQWKTLIAELLDSDLTQQQIAEKCECGQATISDLARGITSEPKFALRQKLMRLHANKKRSKARKQQSA